MYFTSPCGNFLCGCEVNDDADFPVFKQRFNGRHKFTGGKIKRSNPLTEWLFEENRRSIRRDMLFKLIL